MPWLLLKVTQELHFISPYLSKIVVYLSNCSAMDSEILITVCRMLKHRFPLERLLV